MIVDEEERIKWFKEYARHTIGEEELCKKCGNVPELIVNYGYWLNGHWFDTDRCYDCVDWKEIGWRP